MKHPHHQWAIRRPGIIPVFFLSAFFPLIGQTVLPDARSIAVGKILAVADPGTRPYANPASLGCQKAYSFSISQSFPFLIKDLVASSLEAAIPLFPGTLRIDLSSFGIPGYRNFSHGLGYGTKLSDKLFAGIGFRYFHSMTMGKFSYLWNLSPEVGLLLKISESTSLGMMLNSPVNMGNYSEYGPLYPSIATIACCHEFYENCFLLTELAGNSDGTLTYKMAISGLIGKRVSISSGYQSAPRCITFGARIISKDLNIFFAFAWSPVPGTTPSLTLCYSPEK